MRRGTLLFGSWALVGAVITDGVIYALFPAALGLVVIAAGLLLARFIPTNGGSRSPEIFGLIAGPGVYCFLAAANAGHAVRWVGVGVAFLGAALLAYWVADRTHPSRPAPGTAPK